MDFFNIVKRYYEAGHYTIEQVRVFVEKEKITLFQFEEITGQPY